MRAIRLLLVGGLLLWGTSALADEGLQLRYRLQPDQVFYYTRSITAAANMQLSAGQPLRLQIKARERVQRQVLGVLPDGSFRLQDRRLLNLQLNGHDLPVPVLGPQEIRLSPLGARRVPAGSILGTLTPLWTPLAGSAARLLYPFPAGCALPRHALANAGRSEPAGWQHRHVDGRFPVPWR
ncbi:MAG TPA: hypothetical protein VHR86_03965 [Armatimonadota bacterium]|nr:hypothetical protein [Armatimonadota bacterium]